MHKALNEILASLPDDTKVYVRWLALQCSSSTELTVLFPARSRVHEAECQVLPQGDAIRTYQEASGVR